MTDATKNGQPARRIVFQILAGLISVGLFLALLFWTAGRFDWLRGWAYVGLMTLGQTVSNVLVWRKNPEVLQRRGQIGEGTKGWDKVLLGPPCLSRCHPNREGMTLASCELSRCHPNREGMTLAEPSGGAR